MKIAHLTDIHFQTDPKLQDLTYIKRLMGSTNLYLLGRKAKFGLEVQRKSVAKIVEMKPDLVILTGDLTAQALDAEFDLARKELDPILSAFPTVVIAGNHDTYIDPFPQNMRDRFTPWLANDGCDLRTFGDVGVLTIESCRPTLLSNGFVAPERLTKASELLAQSTASFHFMCMHYPLLNRRGGTYGPSTRALANADAVLEWLKDESKIGAYLHGHEHHGYMVDLASQAGPIPSINPGVSGYNIDLKKKRFPHVACYTVEDGVLQHIERWQLMDIKTGYTLEPGEAFSSRL